MELVRTDIRPHADVDDDAAPAICTVTTETFAILDGGVSYTEFMSATVSNDAVDDIEEAEIFAVETRYADAGYHEIRAMRQHWDAVNKAYEHYSVDDAEFPLRQITYYPQPAFVAVRFK